MCVCVCILYVLYYTYVYRGELTHMIMEADRFKDLQWASWRPKGANGIVPVNPSSLKIQKELMFQFKSKRQLDRRSSLLFAGTAFSFCSGLQLIGQGPSTLEKVVCFIQSIDSNVNFIQNTLTDISRIVFDPISGHPMTQAIDT